MSIRERDIRMRSMRKPGRSGTTSRTVTGLKKHAEDTCDKQQAHEKQHTSGKVEESEKRTTQGT